MKIMSLIVEAILSPLSLLLKVSGNGKNPFTSLAKPVFIFLIAIGITAILLVYFYQIGRAHV